MWPSALAVLVMGQPMRYHILRQFKGVEDMFSVRNVCGHYQVYDGRGLFLFSADSEGEAWEELEDYAEFEVANRL